MALRPRIYYNAEQKAEMWDRWQRGALPVTILGAFLTAHMATQESPSEEQGQRQRTPDSL